jgi:8-oxo-dGTP pyrophosphatase MutT (NUDIX family)
MAADTTDAVVAVLRREGLVLVIRRGPDVILPGYWTPLSGRVRSGESQPSAVVREVREEVGLEATPVARVWECDTEDGAFHLHWWLADAGPGELRLDPAEVTNARWIRPDEFANLTPTFADDRYFFAQILPEVGQP